jgi:hypothetical protein
MNAVDTLEIAKGAFERVREAFPSLEVVEDTATQVDVSLDIPVQPGMKHHVHLNLQNIDELHFNVGSFWLAWFPCTDSAPAAFAFSSITGASDASRRNFKRPPTEDGTRSEPRLGFPFQSHRALSSG